MNQLNPQLIKDFSEAEKLSNEKKYEESIKKYETILEKYPNFIPAINNIGFTRGVITNKEYQLRNMK